MRDGDRIRIDAEAGTMDALVDRGRVGGARRRNSATLRANRIGLGRELFALMRAQVGTAEQGGSAACSSSEDAVSARRMSAVAGTGRRHRRHQRALRAHRSRHAPTPAMQRAAVAGERLEFASLQHAAEHYLQSVGVEPKRARDRGGVPRVTATRSA